MMRLNTKELRIGCYHTFFCAFVLNLSTQHADEGHHYNLLYIPQTTHSRELFHYSFGFRPSWRDREMFVCHAAARRFSVVMGNTYGTTTEHMTDFTLSAAGPVPH